MKMNRLSLLILSLLLLSTTVSNGEDLCVVTINVWSGLDYKGALQIGEYQDEEIRASRTRNLVRQLLEVGPDLVAVNEANMLSFYFCFFFQEF